MFLITFSEGFTQKINFLRKKLEKKEFLSDPILYNAFYELAIEYKKNNTQLDSALFFINEAIKIAKSSSNQFELGQAFLLKGEIYLFSGWGYSSIWLSFENTSEACKIFNKLKNKKKFSEALNLLSISYISRRYNNSHYTEKQLKYSILSGEALLNPHFFFPNSFEADTTDQIASVKTLNNAIIKFKLHLSAYSEKKDSLNMMYLNQKIAVCYIEIANIKEFEKFNLVALQLAQKLKNHQFEGSVFLSLVHYFHLFKEYDKQKFYAEKGLKNAKENNQKIKVAQFSDQLYYYYKEKGDFKQALSHKELNIHIFDSLTVLGEKQRNELIQQKNDALKLQFQAEQSLIKKEQQQYFLILLLATIVALGGTIFWNNRILKNKNKELLDKNAAITQAHLKGQTTERQRVAIDLHDNLGSTLSSIGYSMEAIDKTRMNKNEKDIYKNLQDMVSKAYNDVRLLSHNLLPEDFEKQGLKATLDSLVRKINKNSIIKFELKVDENFGRVDKKIEFELYSICLELVNNIMKHSKATEASILLSKKAASRVAREASASELVLTVSDNGIGTFKNDSDGMGMKNIQARVQSIGGKWIVKATEGEGVINEIVV